MKTNQEIFDIVAKHLLTQKVKSECVLNPGTVYSHVSCRYRGDNGRKCAAGVLMPDALYNDVLEGWSVANIRVLAAMPDVEMESVPLVERLQKLHDLVQPYDWYDELCFLAGEERLSFNAAAYVAQS